MRGLSTVGRQYGATMSPAERRVPRPLIPLGQGVYTITETCRILQPRMTRAKVHYWLNTGLLSEPPVAHRGSGVPTLLTFRQLLEVRTVQHLRDELKVSLPRVRDAFEWVLETLFATTPSEVRFELGPGPRVIATRPGGESVVVRTGQGAFPMNVDELNVTMAATRVAWERQAFVIPNHPKLVANARVHAGSPTIVGTRVDTALLAGFAREDGTYDEEVLERAVRTYPYLSLAEVEEALIFEGSRRAA